MFKNKSISESMPRDFVNIEDKKRSNLFSWRGQFSPQLIEQILLHYASSGDVIFDPFLGSGTVLYESALLGFDASGCEINPAAVSFSKVYELMTKPKDLVLLSIDKLDSFMSFYITKQENIEELESNLINLLENSMNDIDITILMALITGLDFGAKKLTLKRVESTWDLLKKTIINFPEKQLNIKCFHNDSRCSPLNNNSIDFVITSPPYINVFNYHQNYRKSVESTGVDVLKVAKSEIGANRKFRQNRFLTVVQYCMDMAMVFQELHRVCKLDAKVIFIVGEESNVRRTAFKNAELIRNVAKSCGFSLLGKQQRVFKNKFGVLIYEDILRFNIVTDCNEDAIELAREIGRDALYNSISYCSEDVIDEIKEAYEKSKLISCSPLLEK